MVSPNRFGRCGAVPARCIPTAAQGTVPQPVTVLELGRPHHRPDPVPGHGQAGVSAGSRTPSRRTAGVTASTTSPPSTPKPRGALRVIVVERVAPFVAAQRSLRCCYLDVTGPDVAGHDVAALRHGQHLAPCYGVVPDSSSALRSHSRRASSGSRALSDDGAGFRFS